MKSTDIFKISISKTITPIKLTHEVNNALSGI